MEMVFCILLCISYILVFEVGGIDTNIRNLEFFHAKLRIHYGLTTQKMVLKSEC